MAWVQWEAWAVTEAAGVPAGDLHSLDYCNNGTTQSINNNSHIISPSSIVISMRLKEEVLSMTMD